MSETIFYVYKHVSPTGKVYIGITSQKPERRWNRGMGYNKQPYFYRAIQKYGWDCFQHEILYSGLSLEEASFREKEMIQKSKSCDPRFGYNSSAGGFGGMCGVKDSDKTRHRKSESAKRAWLNPNRRGVHKCEVVNGVRLRKGHTGLGQKKKPVLQYTLENDFVKRWESVCEIERELGIHTGKISECCNGKRSSVKGYRWVFAEVVT